MLRWQRRWFVLYDDGELTYSVDEHPETVPQACIDMTKVLEVSSAEMITGHSNSIAITAPDRVTFVKGTCPEEAKWWHNILSAFPKSKGRHKRNATFPGGQATTILQSSTPPNGRNRHNSYHKDTLTSTISSGVGGTEGGKDIIGPSSWDEETSSSNIPPTTQDENNKNAGNENTNRVYTDQPVSSKSPPTRDKIYPETKAHARIRNRNRSAPTPQEDEDQVSSRLLIEDAHREDKLKDFANSITNNLNQIASSTTRWQQTTNQTITTPTLSSTTPSSAPQKPSATCVSNYIHQNHNNNHHSHQNNMDEQPTRDEPDMPPHQQQHLHLHHNQTNHPAHYPEISTTITTTATSTSNMITTSPVSATTIPLQRDYHSKIVNLRPKSLPLASSTAPAIVSAIVKKIPNITKDNNSASIISNTTNKNNSSSINSSSSKSSLATRLYQQLHQPKQQTQKQQSQERGDPDGGCNVDDVPANYLSNNAELRVGHGAEDILNLKKGWLMKHDLRAKEWTKHWFSLRGAALFYYRDSVAEERGVLDGVLDVNCLTNVSELTTGRSYSFQLTTWDKRRIILAAASASSRTNWIIVLRTAAGLPSLQEPKPLDDSAQELIIKDNTSDDLKSEIEKDFIKAQMSQETIRNNLAIHDTRAETVATPSKETPTDATPATPKPVVFSSDEEYRTASEGGRRDSVDWGSPLSPSPPLPTSLFRAKERMRSRSSSNSRLHKRSRSSPPSSRRSTVDSVGSDELPVIHPVQEELNIDKELQLRLGLAEKERDMLREEARDRDSRMSELLTTLEKTELALTSRIRDVEEARDKLSRELTDANGKAEVIVAQLTNELEENQKKIKSLEDRLARGIEENEALYKKLREIEGGSPSNFSNLNRTKFKRVDSLSDLTNLTDIDPYCLDRDMLAEEYNELKSRFEKAVNEIKAMKKELKESQNQYDALEISYAALKQDLQQQGSEDRSQLQMMAERIRDLTLKYTTSERQVRSLKQKLAKSERRRSLSLKGKDGTTVPKELEEKVNDLESKIDSIERSSSEKLMKSASDERLLRKTAPHVRRRSLESTSGDSLQFMVRLNALEKRLEHSSSPVPKIPEGTVMNNYSSPKSSEHVIERLRCLEAVLISSKDRIEQSLQQLQSLRSSRTRRSVSPITERKDSIRFVERCLAEVVKVMRESCQTCLPTVEGGNQMNIVQLPESSPIKQALVQLEVQLREKLGDLLKQRRILRERNQLTPQKDLELLAERVAFESVCFGKLRDSITRAENPSMFGEKQTKAELAETSQLMAMLKAKLSGKCSFKPTGSIDVLASVLARRLVLTSGRNGQQTISELPPVSQRSMDELLRQQNEINLITKRYKNNAMESLACALAAETLSYISSNDTVQGAVQEAWRHAQEAVNSELIQSEITHIMMRNAECFESSVTPAFGYTLTPEERISFENFADAVQDILRKEMENAIDQLTQCYEECLGKMKRGQWRLHLEQERKASEGRQLLSEFADVIAHKALIDARIAVLKGAYVSKEISKPNVSTEFSIVTLQKYETLFEELSQDLQICSADDILAEADFNFMYKKFSNDFTTDRAQMLSVAASLKKLEESLAVMFNTLSPNMSLPISVRSVETLEDVQNLTSHLEDSVQDMIPIAQQLRNSCEECEKMQVSLCNLTAYHEDQLKALQEAHDKDVASLRKHMDEYAGTIKLLESERNNLLEELNHQSNLVEDHERELSAITLKLKTKEDECHREKDENAELCERLEASENRYKTLSDEKQTLTQKCLLQNEEYAALLQERDFIQNELNMERDRSRKLEKRLEMLELEHTKQLECLKEAYKDQILAHCSDFTSLTNDEESFRQRYQAEIEQLRTLCEKGLAAMESSHRRIVSDLEEKHRKEIDRLLVEKEQALAEETQATLAALDAMRKAHQSEVQREVARFKQEFLRQFHKGEQSNVPVKEKEEELDELRQEILSFSEKYSIKCVENATLEERLRVANQKLRQFQQMQQLELRNQQFRAHLASEDPSDLNFVQGLSTKEDSPSPDSEHAVDVMRVNSATANDTTTIVKQISSAHDINTDRSDFSGKSETGSHSFRSLSSKFGLNKGLKPPYSSINSSSGIQNSHRRYQHRTIEIGSINSTQTVSTSTPFPAPSTSARNLWTSEIPSINCQAANRGQSEAKFTTKTLKTDLKPVEQPKTYTVLASKLNFDSNSQQSTLEANRKDNCYASLYATPLRSDRRPDQTHNPLLKGSSAKPDDPTKPTIDRRLAVSLSSLSELLNTNPSSGNVSTNPKMTSISCSIQSSNSNSATPTNRKLRSRSQAGTSSSKVRLVRRIYEKQENSVANQKIASKSVIDQTKDDDESKMNPLDSEAVSRKPSSPSPLDGRDVEQHTTSKVRRFELKI
ncbi:unnamed protein product [Hermetia illucens]|uniref:PH domain-containing protein n=1 Tax=Hermetia illucens TaxID=343691 RepID=A0A7R8URZ1_HERIL|nr:unnamed protein product [Hermetia illucens]